MTATPRLLGPVCVAAVLAVGCASAGMPGAGRPPAGGILLQVDTDARVSVDDEPVVTVTAGEVRTLPVVPGLHTLRVASLGREARHESTLEVAKAPVEVRIALRSMVDDVRRAYVLVPGGTFEMGCVPGDDACDDDENPRHPVTVRDFWMMRTEVEAAPYLAAVRARRREIPEAPAHNPDWSDGTRPITNVTWADADRYCRATGSRLPTEAEWEHAARAGQAGRKYTWGDDTTPLVSGKPAANVSDDASRRKLGTAWFHGYDDGFAESSPVGSFPANELGLHDLAGNVWEWCSDRYEPRYYAQSPKLDPRGALESDAHVLRGGAWAGKPSGLRISNRVAFTKDAHDFYLGFRCARSAD